MPPNDTTFPAEHILSNDNKHYLSAHSDNIKVRMVRSATHGHSTTKMRVKM